MPIPETQRRRRGHAFNPPKAVKVPALLATESTPAADKTVHVHYFVGSCDWYIVELDRDTGEAFGYADLGGGGGEWGYINLTELEAVAVGPYRQPVERDMWWQPRPARDVPGLAAPARA